jgi:ribonuclease BN (tRNA processing enzyme)
MAATWTVLGAGTILPRVGYGSAGYALRAGPGGGVTLFDCGPGTIRALAPAGIGLREVRRVVISHFHLDHCLDLFALAFARHNPAFRSPPPLEIVGPAGLAELLDRGEGTLGRWAHAPGAEVTEVELGRGKRGEIERDGLHLSCVATGHTKEALAWRADLASGVSVAYSGDTGENTAVADLARDAELFTVECSFPDGAPVPKHLTPSSAARLADRAQCRRLLLTHFYPDVEPEAARAVAARTFRGAIELARDGSVHEL